MRACACSRRSASSGVALAAGDSGDAIHDPCCLPFAPAILASAVAALAQPLSSDEQSTQRIARGIARAIIVDTSESMRQADASGARPIDAARREAERLARDAQTSLVIQSATPRRALAGAADWIARQHRRAELVIVSDFQTGTIDRRDLDAMPRAAGIRLLRVPAVQGPVESVAQAGDVETSHA